MSANSIVSSILEEIIEKVRNESTLNNYIRFFVRSPQIFYGTDYYSSEDEQWWYPSADECMYEMDDVSEYVP